MKIKTDKTHIKMMRLDVGMFEGIYLFRFGFKDKIPNLLSKNSDSYCDKCNRKIQNFHCGLLKRGIPPLTHKKSKKKPSPKTELGFPRLSQTFLIHLSHHLRWSDYSKNDRQNQL